MANMKSVLRFLQLGLASIGLALATGASAQGFPSKQIRLISPYPPGGSNDGLARQIAPILSEKLGQPVVVENRPGASTAVAAQVLASAPADGHTIAILDPSTLAINPFLFKKLSYDPAKIQPVSRLVKIPFGIMVQPNFPANNLREFVAYAKSKPGLTFGVAGPGVGPHLAMERFRKIAGLDMTAVPYKGGTPAMQGLLSGEIDVYVNDIAGVFSQIKGGKMKAIAIMTDRRSEQLPDVATITESGFSGFEAGAWFGAFVPQGTPTAVIEKLSSALGESVSAPKVKGWIRDVTLELAPSTPEEFEKVIKSDRDDYSKVVQALGLTLD